MFSSPIHNRMSFSSSRRVFGGPNTLPSSQQTINRDRYDSTGNGNNGRLGGGLFDEPEARHHTHFGRGREGPIREEQIYGNESEGITRPDCGPPPRRNLGHGVYNGNQQQMGRPRRAKYFPPQKEDVDLFDEERQIQKGPQFDAQYGEQRDDEIVVVPTFNHLIKSFEECNFSREILNNIKLSKYTDPTPIQKAVIPLTSHTTKDIMGNAQTGSGKTAAFLLPIISWIQIKVARSHSHAINRDSPYCVVLEPTKELAEQIFEDARKLATNTNVSIARSYGDMPMKSCLQAMERGCDILVITSGRLSHHIFASHIKLSNLRFFVMDEADKLIRDKFFNEAAHELVDHREIHPEYRVLLFSATFSTEVQDKSQEFIRPDRYFVRVGNMNRAAETIEQFFLEVEHPEKADKLLEILQENAVQKKLPDGRSILVPAKKTIIFVAEKRRADYLAIFLNSKSFLVMSLNSDRSLEQRLRTFDDFKRDKNMILVTTDVAARGVNMPGVEHVINFNLPHWDDEQDSYIHRIGRTGRAGNVGMATSFFDPTDFNDIRNVNYYIKNLQRGQEMPEVLRKYYVEQLNNTREQFYEEGRVPGEQQDAWGNTNTTHECRPVLNEPMTSSSSKSGANHFQQSNEVPRYTGINNTKQQQFNNPTIFGRNQQTVRTNNAYPYANENLPSHLGATLDNAHGTESSFIDDFDDKW